MSMIREVQIECPECHTKFPFTVHDSINVGIDPQDKDKVLDMSIFQYNCPHCGKTDIVCYPLLYHDPINGVWIQVFWKEKNFGQPVSKEIQELIKIMGQDHYRRREVFGYWELIEKIRVFDAGLDDFTIAMMKTANKVKEPEIKLIFDEKKGKYLRFLQFRNGEMLPQGVCFGEDGYEVALNMARRWKKPHKYYENLRVDESYFYDDLMNALRQENQ